MTANDRFKEAMSLIPTSVAVVWITDQQNHFSGCTISSFISVSVIQESEEVAFVLRGNSRTGEIIRNSKSFKISILSRDQIEIASVFSKSLQKVDLNLALEEYPKWPENSVCEFSLTMKQEIILTNSTLFIAKVTSFKSNPTSHPLVYVAREYLRIGD